MPLEGGDYLLRVPALERGEDRCMEIGRPKRVRAGNGKGEIRPRERLEGAPDLLERAVVRELDDAPVESGIGLGHGMTVVVASRHPHGLEVAGELRDVRVGQPWDRQPAAERLQG